MATIAASWPITMGHIYGIKYLKRRKFGKGLLARHVFMNWFFDTTGCFCDIEDLRDHEAVMLIAAMKRLPDVPPEGQGRLGEVGQEGGE